MKQHRILIFSSATLLVLLLYACISTTKVSVQNIADMYRSDYQYLHPQFRIYQAGDSSSILYYKLNEDELLYIRRNEQDSFYASVRVVCLVTAAYESSVVLDSNSVSLRVSSITNTKKDFAIGALPIKLNVNQSYLVTVKTTDMISKKEAITYLPAENTNGMGGRNFLVKNNADGRVLFPDYIDSAANLSVTFNKPVQKLTVYYYHRNFPLAAPPFSNIAHTPFKFNPDSSFTLTKGSHNTFNLKAGPKGIYHIMADTAGHSGLTIYRLNPHFPDIDVAGQMVHPLRYITSNEEYRLLTGAKDVKKAVDNFWLNIAGNSKERARALIRIYYNRVQQANNYFTSYLEGWKTDRGMIYIIYGPPSVVYRSSTGESWTYGEDRNFMSLVFTFEKVNNPFSDNDYELQRSPLFRDEWYNQVDVWRQGRVY